MASRREGKLAMDRKKAKCFAKAKTRRINGKPRYLQNGVIG